MKNTYIIDRNRFDLWPQGVYENTNHNGYRWSQYDFVNSTQSTRWISILIYRMPR